MLAPYFDFSGKHHLIEDSDIIHSDDSEKYGIGADVRAGCAILWLLKDLGHHIIVCDYENLHLRCRWKLRWFKVF